MNSPKPNCVILADRHHGLTEGVRGLLSSEFEVVVMVSDQRSLMESAGKLQPEMIVADLSLADGDNRSWLRQMRQGCPGSKLIVISVHDEPVAHETVLEAGADAFLLKRSLAGELLEAVKVLRSGRYSPDMVASTAPPTEEGA